MTLLQKIQNLTWWTLDIKLKDILTDLFTTTESIDTRVTDIENTAPPVQVLQDLKSVVDVGGYAWKDNEFNYISLLNGTAYDRSIGWDINNASGSYSNLLFTNGNILIDSTTPANGMQIRSVGGVFNLTQHTSDVFTNTTVNINSPVVSTVISVPAKTIAGNYKFSAEPTATYTVATLPVGQLRDTAVVTDATAPTYLGALTGGGAVVCPVWHNGTIWVAR